MSTRIIAGVFAVLIAGPALAQQSESVIERAQPTVAPGLSGFEADAPPGVDGPFSPFPEREIEIVRPFGDDVTDSRDSQFAPLNEFAGQTRRYEPGLIGEALGRVKRSIIGSFSEDAEVR